MGGWGSGRHWWDAKATTGDFRRLDVRKLSRGGWLRPGLEFTTTWYWRDTAQSTIRSNTYDDRIVVSYRHQYDGKPWEDLQYPIFLERTRCHYGGSRTWFRCPGWNCRQRVAILYAGRLFLCRHCRQLAYESQRQSPIDRALCRAQDLHIRMGGDGVVIEGEPFRRKGMHKKTYDRLMQRYRWLDLSLKVEEIKRFGRCIDGIDRW